MSDILKYRFYLNFKNEGSFGRMEITEPIGFDGASFVVEQEPKRYGRDAYKINEEINLNFYKGNYDPTTIQTTPNGTNVYHLTMGFDFLIDNFNTYGFESDVDFEIELDNVVFIPANLDFQTSETDGYTYFSCKAVQTQAKQLIKRRSDIVTDIFSTEDLDGNEVAPAQTENILLKAKPIQQISEWLGHTGFYRVRNVTSGDNTSYFNGTNNIIKSNIDDTLGYLPSSDPRDMTYIEALNDLVNVNIKVDVNLTFQKFIGNIGSGTLKMQYFIGEDSDINFDGINQVVGAFNIFQESISNAEVITVNETFEFFAPDIPRARVF